MAALNVHDGASAPRFWGLTGRQWRRLGLGAALVLGLVIPLITTDYRTFQYTLALVYAIAILGLNLLTGFSGQISLGHGAFYALGAYTAAIMMDRWELPYFLTLPVAGFLCLGIGFVFGFPAARLRGHYLALATFALAVAVPQILKYDLFEGWTGGVQGIVIIKPDAPFGLPLSQDQWLYYFTLAVVVLLYIFAANLLNSRSGRALVAIRDQSVAASAMGVNVPIYKSLAFGISAGYTGIAGALGAIVVQFVAPDSFNFLVSIILVVGMVVGGLASIWGAVIGGLFIQFVPNIAEEISKAAPWAIYGVILISLMYLMPRGAAGLASTLGTWIMARSGQIPAMGLDKQPAGGTDK